VLLPRRAHPPLRPPCRCWAVAPSRHGGRDPEFLDARAALTAFLWGAGRRAQAEGEWEALQQAGDGLGAALYGRSAAVARVQHRWPPRATAALVAFLALADRGQAEGYDLVVHEYTFAGGVQ
jgi:hypothetical protein